MLHTQVYSQLKQQELYSVLDTAMTTATTFPCQVCPGVMRVLQEKKVLRESNCYVYLLFATT